jgi:hypothetical protein
MKLQKVLGRIVSSVTEEILLKSLIQCREDILLDIAHSVII